MKKHNEDRFKQVSMAYDILGSSEKKKLYDIMRTANSQGSYDSTGGRGGRGDPYAD